MAEADPRPPLEGTEAYRLPDRPVGAPLPRIGPLVGLPVKPRMPLVTPDMPDLERARLLARAYRAAAVRFAAPTWQFARGVTERSKHYRVLVQAARRLEEAGVSPMHWISWGMVQWQRIRRLEGDKRQAAPVGWLFSKKAMESHACAAGYDARGLAPPGTEHWPDGWLLEPVARWNRMDRELRRRGAPPFTEAAEAIQQEFFPPGEFEQIVNEARWDRVRLTAEWQRLADRGEWMWH